MHYNEEQQMLADGVDRFVREHGRFEQWRALTAQGLAFDESNWNRMAEMGWLALAIPEKLGGFGASATETMIVAEGFGRGLLREPYVSTAVLAARILARAAEPTHHEILIAIAEGKIKVATALAEQNGRFDLGFVQTVAQPCPGGFELTGIKTWVPDGSSAHWFIVPARIAGSNDTSDSIALFLIPSDAPGLERLDFRSPDYQHSSQLKLHQVRVAEVQVIGPLHQGFQILQYGVDHAIAARLAEACGAMETVASMTLDYLKVRKQFGTTIGSFQALQHRMVDMTIACEEARSMLQLVLTHIEGADPERQKAVAMAKARIGQCGYFVGHQAVQLHGGVGTSDELAVSHYLKRLAMIDMAYGNAAYQRDRYIQLSD